MKAVTEKKNSKRKNNDSNNNETMKKESKIERKNILRTAEIFGNATLLPTTISYDSAILPDAIFLTTSSGHLITTSVNPIPTSLINSEKTFTSLNNSTTIPLHDQIKIEEQKLDDINIKKNVQRTEGNPAATSTKKKKNEVAHKPSATQLPDENSETRTRKKKKNKKKNSNHNNSNTTISSTSNNIEHQIIEPLISSSTSTAASNTQPGQQLVTPSLTTAVSSNSLLSTTQILTTGIPTTAFVVANGDENKDDLITPQTISGATFANFPLIASGLTAGFAAQTNFTTFSLQSPLLTPGLTIPLYNSLVAVSATKDGVLPSLTKDLFPTAAALTTQKTTKTSKKTKNSNTNSNGVSQNGNNMTTSRGRKRTAQSRLPAKLKEPAAVARRNARERRRVKMVNDGFLRLRRHVPTDPKNKKLSKVKTLRLAIEYIHHLQQLLQSDSNTKQTTQSLVSFTAQVTNYEDLDGGPDSEWLQSDSLTRVNREIDEDIFQTIDPARLRTTYTEYVTR